MEIPLHGWRDLFRRWPAELPRRGIIMTSMGEGIPFSGFLTCEGFLLVARTTPDSAGARTVVLPYENVVALKLTDVVKPKVFAMLGFEGELTKT